MENNILKNKVNKIYDLLGNNNEIISKSFYIGTDESTQGTIIYINGLVNKDKIDRDILKPLMIYIQEDISGKDNLEEYICKKYIYTSNTFITTDLDEVVEYVKRGKTVIIISDTSNYIIVDTTGGAHRHVEDSINEAAIKGPRESFVENLEINISIVRRRIKDKNLKLERLVVGKRSQTDISIIYIDDVADKSLVNYTKERIQMVDVDFISSSEMLIQYIEEHTYSIFPQIYSTERPDVIEANLMEGKIAIIIDGTPQVITLPTLFIEFFQTVGDYYERFIVSSFTRLLRIASVFTIITLPSLYLAFIKFNVELIPLKFIVPIINSRIGISLSPFFEIFLMDIAIEVLREGGLRLPSKIAQTLSVVGGIILGQMAVEAKVVSPDTLLVVGISVISTFLIPNYEMALTIRILKFPLLVITNFMGILGIILFWFVIIVHLLDLDSFGVPYISVSKSDLKDEMIRAPLWRINKRPSDISNKNPIRQTDFRAKFRRTKLGKKK
ncbi:spore germination protein [Clostridium lundense]|uniref:spore germination protein n=1 Tax=Clostridium lundense TaxID=319475 RepID=UPI00048A039B|nr:spore germination protein [Clostridium lundense]